MLEVEPEDTAHKLFIALTQNNKCSIISTLNLDQSSLKDLGATDTDGNNLALDDWKVSEIINISRHAKHLREQKGEEFRLKDVEISSFEDFKLSPAYMQVQYAQGNITRTLPSSLTSSHSPNVQQNWDHTPAETFKRGIKRDVTIYSAFKDGKQWDT